MLFVFLSKGKQNGGGGGLKEAGINLKDEGKLAIKTHRQISTRACSCSCPVVVFDKSIAISIIGHLHDGVILLLRPESFSFFFSYLNLVIPARFMTKAVICTRKQNPEGFWS